MSEKVAKNTTKPVPSQMCELNFAEIQKDVSSKIYIKQIEREKPPLQ